ncbi:hypothetical protein ES705_01633 [subsurface metagenome]|nr:hypothetical protein [Clostridia bacterium]
MEYIICCLNIKESYVRITNHFKGHPYIGFEEYICDIDEVKNKFLYKKWQYAVVDKKLPWREQAEKFFKKNNIEIIYFNDDYSDVITSIKNKVPRPPEDLGENCEFSKGPGSGTGVRYIEKPTTKIVERKIYTGIEKKLIIISSLTRCAGATTITLSLAKYLSNLGILSSVIEPPIGSPAIFNCIGIAERLSKSGEGYEDNFYSYPHEIAGGKRIKNKAEYIFDNIVWIVPDDRKEAIDNWKYNQMLQLIYVSNIAPITLIDVGDNLNHESVRPLLSSVDLVLVVIDPFPTNFYINRHKLLNLEKLKSDGCPINFIMNKWNSGIEEKEFLDFIQVKPLAFIPAIDLAILYKANYQYEMPLCSREVSDLISEPLAKICSLFIPKEFKGDFSKNKKDKKRSLFSDIVGKFKRS